MKKVVFLDRDGTINVDHGYVYRVSDWEFVEKAPEALKKLQDAGFKLAVVTNQSGIGRGYYALDDMHALHEHMRSELQKEGVTIDALAFCPHDPDLDCECRKPAPGMARQIEEQLGEIDYAASWTIGDKDKDIEFGKGLGTKTALIRSKYWQEDELSLKPDILVDSLFEAATAITV
jgi:D-glycero-D-manno-heptose 1,7-bisphosphate phosphatase